MKNIPMEILRSFVTISQLGSFTKAGDLLGKSQPAISLQIKRLEDEIGELFIRESQILELTETGQRLLNYAKKILYLNDEALSQLNIETISGKVKLGIPSEFATALLPKIVGRFVRTYPNITLEVNCDLVKNLFSSTGRKQHDIILLLHDDNKKVSHDWIKTDELVWVGSHEHNIRMRPQIPLIVAPKGCIYRKRVMTVLDNHTQPWKIVYTIQDLNGIKAAIEEGLGITALAKSTVSDNLKILGPSDKLPKLGNIGISVVITNRNSNEAIEKMSEFLKASLAVSNSFDPNTP